MTQIRGKISHFSPTIEFNKFARKYPPSPEITVGSEQAPTQKQQFFKLQRNSFYFTEKIIMSLLNITTIFDYIVHTPNYTQNLKKIKP